MLLEISGGQGMRTQGAWFIDELGRKLILRGVNLGGSSKIPRTPNGATHIQEGFFDHRRVSFVGRPFPLDEADEHFSRLRAWGLTFLRFLVTWEAIEHAGPGQYDLEYLEYLEEVIARAGEYGLKLFIDPHQDVWSRFCGGDGAPGWTLEIAGFDLTKLHQTGAAFLHQIHGDPPPRLIWPTNGTKLAAATMFTLFFAGNLFAPKYKVDGEPIQEFLQQHYCSALQQVAQRLKSFSHVVGYDTMNEPLTGYIGWQDLSKAHAIVELGAIPSPYQSMLLASGIPQQVPIWERRILGPKILEKKWLNLEGERTWLPGCECIWKQHGVWELDAHGNPILLRPDYFAHLHGRRVDFNRDAYLPFTRRFIQAVRKVHPEALIFIEHALDHPAPVWEGPRVKGLVFAPHWYDGATMFLKRYLHVLGFDQLTRKIVIGPRAIRQAISRHLLSFKNHSRELLGGIPVLIGETGIPFDFYEGRAYRTGDFRPQIRALQRTLQIMDEHLLSYTLWNYTADNTNARGDQWNGEDFSIFSRDQQDNPQDIHSGGRALEAVVRPYAMATAGEPLHASFDPWNKRFSYTYEEDVSIDAPTLIFVPKFQYPEGFRVHLSDGSYCYDFEAQVLSYIPARHGGRHAIEILPVKGVT